MLGAIFDFGRTFFSLGRIKMSHKRPSKRGINAIDYTNSDYSPTSKSVPQKRPRIEEYSEFQVQTKSPDETPSVRRRSSRAPKPKVFDDEYMDTSVRSPGSDREVQKKKDPKASISRDQGQRRSIDDALVVIDDQDTTTRRSSRVPKPKIFDEDYVEPTKIKSSNDKNEKSMAYATDSKILQDEQKDVSQKSKIQNKDKIKGKITSKSINQQDVDIAVGPKKTVSGAQRPKKANNNSKHVKASPIAESQRPLKSKEELDAKGSPKVRTSSRTPVPKKTFALIDDSPISKPAESIQGLEDLHMGVLSQGPHGLKPSEKISLTQSDSSLTSGEEMDIIYASPFIGKKKGNSKLQEAGSDGEKKRKISKKSKAASDSLDVSKDIMARETTKQLEGKKSGNVIGNITKDKNKKGSSKDIDSKIDINKGDIKRKKKDAIESIVDVVGEMSKEVKKKSKKKKVEVEEVALQQNVSNAANSTPGSHEDKHSFSEHGKKSSKHSKTKHKDEPHSEVKDEDHHIILKVHLPHAEGSHHSHSSHKKHKHKHSSESRSGTESDSKAKKQKLSLESDSSSEDKHKKKLSIKFKGLSSSTPGVEFEGAKEPVGKEKGKKDEDLGSEGTKKKASKKASHDKPSVASSSDEKEHVKVVIKKTKQDIKVLTDDGQKSVKKGANKGGKEKAKEDKEQNSEASTSSKTTPKKKSKVESPKSAEKEKRKIVSGYLLFCKKERSRINEANPGLEFAQISQKVGEAWKNLPESIRQEWKAKANDVKRTLLVQQEQKKTETTYTKSGTDAVDMAAHLKLLGESLSVIGASLMAQRETEVHGSLSVLLDSILCAICPLTFLTSHIPGIPGIAKDKQLQILDDLAYTMPGLG